MSVDKEMVLKLSADFAKVIEETEKRIAREITFPELIYAAERAGEIAARAFARDWLGFGGDEPT